MPQDNTAKIVHYLVIFAYGVLITLSPSIHFIQYIEFHDCQRVLQLALLSLVLIASIFSYKNTSIIINKKVYYGAATILALAILSTCLSIKPRYAVIEICLLTALGFFAFFVARLFITNKEVFIKQLVFALWASILLYMFSFYVGYITAMAVKKTLVWPYPFFGFSNIRFFQQYQLGALGLICLPLLAFELKQRHRILLHIALIFWWVLLFYAASRGSAIAWMLAMLATAIVYKKQASAFLRIQLLSTVAGFMTYLLLFKAIPAWITATDASKAAVVTGNIFRSTISDRLYLWQGAYEMINNAPILGVGPMQFPFHIAFGTYPHNSLLLLASEWGLPATFLILLIACYGFYCWFNQHKPTKLITAQPNDSSLAIVLFFNIIANVAYSFVSGVHVIPISQVLLFTTIGLMIGQYKIKQPHLSNINPTHHKVNAIPFVALTVLLALTWSVLPEFKRGITSYDRVIGPTDRAFALQPGTINPRIWMQQRPLKQRKN